MPDIKLRMALEQDVPIILDLIKGLAEYEKLSHEVVADETKLRQSLFGDFRFAEVILAEHKGRVVAFALFFHNYSTFLGQPGIYLEDLFVKPEQRGKGIGKLLFSYLGKLCIERNCGRLEWAVLDWNQDAIDFYKKQGAVAMDDWTVFRITGKELELLAAKHI